MATTLYLREAIAASRPDKIPRANLWTAQQYLLKQLSTSRGSTATSAVTNTGSSNTQVPVRKVATDAFFQVWISEPVDQDVTIAGTITFNIRALESAMAANTAIRALLQVSRSAVDADNGRTLTLLARVDRTVELGLSENAENFTFTPSPSVNVKKGDRLILTLYGGDAGQSMAPGYTFTVYYDGPTAGASGDSYVTFTETFGFTTTTPTGSTLYLTDADASGVATTQTEKKLAPARGNGVVSESTTLWDKFSDFTNPQSYRNDPLVLMKDYGTGEQQHADHSSQKLTLDTTSKRMAQSIVPATDIEVFMVGIFCSLTDIGPSATNVVEIRTDNGSDAPSSTVLATTSEFTAAVLVFGENQFVLQSPVALTQGVKYWIVMRATDVTGVAVFALAYGSDGTTDQYTSGTYIYSTNGGSSWTRPANEDLYFTLYTGQRLEWYSEPLAGFTLSDLVTVNVRLKEDAASTHFGVRAELAVTNQNGSGETIWAAAAPSDSSTAELGTSETVYTFVLSGPDLVVNDLQRLRLRVQVMGDLTRTDYTFVSGACSFGTIGESATVYYNGATADASGDSWIRLTQTVTPLDAATAYVDLQSSGTETREHIDVGTLLLDLLASGTDEYVIGFQGYVDDAVVAEVLTASGTDVQEDVDSATVYIDLASSGAELLAHEYTDTATSYLDVTITGTDEVGTPTEYIDTGSIYLDITGTGGECYSTFSGAYLLAAEDAYPRWSPTVYVDRWEGNDEPRWSVVEITSTRGC